MPKETLSPKTLFELQKTLGKSSPNQESSWAFCSFASRERLDQTRHHRPATGDTRRPRRCATSRRSRRWNFKSNRRRTSRDQADEAAAAAAAAVAATVNHRKILDFPATSGHPYSSFPPFLDRPNSFPCSIF